MVIRELFVKIGVDAKGVETGAAQVESKLLSIKQAALGMAAIFAGSAVYGAMQRFVDETTRAADELGKLSESFGLSTDAMQKLGFAADISNVGVDQLRAGLGRLAAHAFQAAQGGDQARELFQRLGISVTDSAGKLKPTEALFREAADAIKGIEDPTKKTAMAMQLFGRDGARLIPLLNGGSKGLDEFGGKLQELGGVVSEQFIADSDELHDGITRLNAAMFGLKAAVVSAILPAFKYDFFTNVVAGVNRLLAGTRFLRVAFVGLGAAAVALGVWMLAPFLPAILAAAGLVVAVLAVTAVVEDLWALFEGKDSLIGRKLAEIGITTERLAPIFEKVRTVASNFWNALSAKAGEFADGSGAKVSSFFQKLQPLAERVLTWIDTKLGEMLDIDWSAKIDGAVKFFTTLLDRAERFVNHPVTKKLFDSLGGSIGTIAGGAAGAAVGAKAGGFLGGAIGGPLGAAIAIGAPLVGGYLGGKVGGSFFGGDEQPTITAPGGGGMALSQSNKIEVSVSGAGGDPAATADAVRQQIEFALDANMEEAYSALVPAVAR